MNRSKQPCRRDSNWYLMKVKANPLSTRDLRMHASPVVGLIYLRLIMFIRLIKLRLLSLMEKTEKSKPKNNSSTPQSKNLPVTMMMIRKEVYK